MKLHAASHVDHGLTQEQVDWVFAQFGDRESFFLQTVELPPELGDVPCGLHGPMVGDDPLADAECHRAVRGERAWTSRLCTREVRRTQLVSVIAGPHEGEACILYTAFGGPIAPQEPGDPGCSDVEASEVFWAQHALTA